MGQRRKRLTPEEKGEMIRLRVEERLSSLEIAEKMNSNTTTVCAIVKPFPLTDDERAARSARVAAIMRNIQRDAGGYIGGDEWSSDDDAVFRKLWPSKPRERVEKAFPDRTWAALIKRGSDLGIRRSRKANHQTKRQVDKFFLSLRDIREARGLSRDEVAARGGFHRVMLARWELGEQRPGWLMLRAWLGALEYEIQAIPANASERARGKRVWLSEEDGMMQELISQGSSIQEISVALRRPADEIERRAQTLGLLESDKTRSVSGMMKARF